MSDFVEALARGNVAEVKVVLASIVAALAVYQVALMAVGYGRVSLPFLKPPAASRAHRAVGDSIVAVTLFIAVLCLSYFEIEDDNALHVTLALALLTVLAVKIAVVRRIVPGDRYLPFLGILVLLLFVITWASTVPGALSD